METMVVISFIDGNKCVDKIKIKKSEINKKAKDATIHDSVIIVSRDVGLFLDKYR